MALGAYTYTHTFADKSDYKKPDTRRPPGLKNIYCNRRPICKNRKRFPPGKHSTFYSSSTLKYNAVQCNIAHPVTCPLCSVPQWQLLLIVGAVKLRNSRQPLSINNVSLATGEASNTGHGILNTHTVQVNIVGLVRGHYSGNTQTT